MDIKKTFENVGKRVIGRGAEVDFSNDVVEYEKMHGVSTEEAQKEIFVLKMQDLSDEMLHKGSIDFNSNEYNSFFAGMREIFDQTEIDNFLVEADIRRSSSSRMPRPSVTSAEYIKMEKQYKNDFPQKNVTGKNKRSPVGPVINETMQNTKMINEMVAILMSDTRVNSSVDLKSLIATNPDLREIFGEILLSKVSVDKQKNQFGREILFDESMAKTKNQTEKTFENGVKEVTQFIKKTLTTTLKGDIKGIVTHVFGGSAELTMKAVGGAAKVGFAGAKTAATYINKEVRK